MSLWKVLKRYLVEELRAILRLNLDLVVASDASD